MGGTGDEEKLNRKRASFKRALVKSEVVGQAFRILLFIFMATVATICIFYDAPRVAAKEKAIAQEQHQEINDQMAEMKKTIDALAKKHEDLKKFSRRMFEAMWGNHFVYDVKSGQHTTNEGREGYDVDDRGQPWTAESIFARL